jgi:sugar lactone lactonase YvrE
VCWLFVISKTLREIRLPLTNIEAKRNAKMEEEMHKGKWIFKLILTVVLGFGWSLAWAQFPNNPTWTTFLKAGDIIGGVAVGAMEGLTGDDNGIFYVADRGPSDTDNSDTCHVWRINYNTGIVDLVGQIEADPCRPSGLARDSNGDLFITTGEGGGIIYRLTPNATNPTSGGALGSVYATGVPGANGVAFLGIDLFVTDGGQNLGRVWKIASCATLPCPAVEFFRIQPMRNSTALGGNVLPTTQPDGVGSERYTVPRHTISAVNNLDRQSITANGVAFSADRGFIFVSDTARGAIWRAELKVNGDLKSNTGCDPTFHSNTLCMDSLYIAHPLLEGVDGIILLTDGTILASVNERNAIVAVTPDKNVADVFRNASDGLFLRNGDGSRQRPLEFPTSPFASGNRFCTTNADTPRRDNNPNTSGEGQKVTCLDHNLSGSGLPLPVQ